MSAEDPVHPPVPDEEAAEGTPGLNVSRRAFLKTVGVTSLASGLIAPGAVEAQAGAAVLGPGEVPVRLTINGRRHDLRIEPRVTLLDAVRTRLDMTGVKRVCDRGSCGACTMIVDGRTVYSCSVLAIEAQGKNIRTVEGLASAGAMHPVQQAFCDKDGLMCGFCTPGFVVASVALLEARPNATPEQVRRGLDGNICRCGTYLRVLEAVAAAGTARRAHLEGPEDPPRAGGAQSAEVRHG
jgi:xanthine dehydrogenase YagT iron-sulfur-binding subunit